jgi:hypothetical protein
VVLSRWHVVIGTVWAGVSGLWFGLFLLNENWLGIFGGVISYYLAVHHLKRARIRQGETYEQMLDRVLDKPVGRRW